MQTAETSQFGKHVSASGSLNIQDEVFRWSQRTPDRAAVIVPQGWDKSGRRNYSHVTFSQLAELVEVYASGLKVLGFARGMRCLLMVKPSIEFFALTFALYRLGVVPVLLDPAMGKQNLLGAIAESEPEALIGVEKAHVARTIYKKAFSSVRHFVTVGRRYWWGGPRLSDVEELGRQARRDGHAVREAKTSPADVAAILFTSGSTGSPKGVLYTHEIFARQLRVFERDFAIVPGETELSAFPLFSLFSVALGVSTVIPDMDPTKPATVDAGRILEAISDHGVNYAFGSPAFWYRVVGHLEHENLRFRSLRRILMAGAPAAPDLLQRLMQRLPEGGEVYTPYGATECLPITLPVASEILHKKAEMTACGAGTFVGTPLPDCEVEIIEISERPIPREEDIKRVPAGEVGEILVRGPLVTQGYFRRQAADRLAKINLKNGQVAHRMGDLGYLDSSGALWFCGRKAHRVETGRQQMLTVCCEAIFNQHPHVYRSALVGRGPRGQETPVIIVECVAGKKPKGAAARDQLTRELLALGAKSTLTREIEVVLFHDSFPVDARHNAKIRREELRLWAEQKVIH